MTSRALKILSVPVHAHLFLLLYVLSLYQVSMEHLPFYVVTSPLLVGVGIVGVTVNQAATQAGVPSLASGEIGTENRLDLPATWVHSQEEAAELYHREAPDWVVFGHGFGPLSRLAPGALDLYRAAARRELAMAVHRGELDDDRAAPLRRLLEDG